MVRGVAFRNGTWNEVVLFTPCGIEFGAYSGEEGGLALGDLLMAIIWVGSLGSFQQEN
jgi:hypothetical protein